MYSINSNFITQIKANNQTNISAVTTAADSYQTKYLTAFDYGILVFAIMVIAFSYIAASKIPSDPKYMIIIIFLLFIFIIMSFIISNMYGSFVENTKFAAFIAESEITWIPFILRYLPYYTIIYCVIVSIGLFQKGDTSL
jgi:hypothetical protein